jgi:hypothetical protein
VIASFSLFYPRFQVRRSLLSFQLYCRLLKGFDGTVSIPISPCLAVVNAFHEQAAVAMDASIAIFPFFAYCIGARLAAVTANRGQAVPRVHHMPASGHGRTTHEGLLHRSVDAQVWYRGFTLMLCSVSVLGSVSYDLGRLGGDLRRQVLCLLSVYARTLLCNRGFVERNVSHDERAP